VSHGDPVDGAAAGPVEAVPAATQAQVGAAGGERRFVHPPGARLFVGPAVPGMLVDPHALLLR
jgi:hypothetical protein